MIWCILSMPQAPNVIYSDGKVGIIHTYTCDRRALEKVFLNKTTLTVSFKATLFVTYRKKLHFSCSRNPSLISYHEQQHCFNCRYISSTMRRDSILTTSAYLDADDAFTVILSANRRATYKQPSADIQPCWKPYQTRTQLQSLKNSIPFFDRG